MDSIVTVAFSNGMRVCVHCALFLLQLNYLLQNDVYLIRCMSLLIYLMGIARERDG